MNVECRMSNVECRKGNIRTVYLMLFVLLAGFLSSPVFSAQQTNAPARPDYAAFKPVYEKNIFNSRRSPQYVASERREPTRRAARTESFALVGTMNHGAGPLAFFEGSASQYRKILKHEETIAGFKVADIEPSFVKLVSLTNELELRIGMQLVREDEGPWRVTARPESVEPRAPATTSSRSSYQSSSNRAPETPPQRSGDNQNSLTDALNAFIPDGAIPQGLLDFQTQPLPNNVNPAPASGGGEEDILAILRRRREQENNP
jgi:hypothetical protein